ncbi:hypothetical protein [Bartonella sp. CL74QHWL]|uniref:hypothetical protein n=1 Tax=Bartonella sp. CL74QHWL TaxID=3243541 RepID=UPI0035CFCBE9
MRAVDFGLALVDGVGVAIIDGIVFFGALNNLRLFILLNFMPLEFLGLLWFFINKPWCFEWHWALQRFYGGLDGFFPNR